MQTKTKLKTALKKVQKILTVANTKIQKGEKLGWRTFGIHFAPAKLSGYNVCKWASKGCTLACLNMLGHGVFDSTQQARIKKTKWFFTDKVGFLTNLWREITNAVKLATKHGLKPCFRLNLTSDIPWENVRLNGVNVFDAFPAVQFYDYTKSTDRMMKFIAGELPTNYHLTLSRSEESDDRVLCSVLESGGNVAVVFRGKLPETWNGYPVINADDHDCRFLDGMGVVAGLVEKGLAKKDETGFVVG